MILNTPRKNLFFNNFFLLAFFLLLFGLYLNVVIKYGFRPLEEEISIPTMVKELQKEENQEDLKAILEGREARNRIFNVIASKDMLFIFIPFFVFYISQYKLYS